MSDRSLYLACALTHVPREQFKAYSEYLHSLAATIERDCKVSVFYALKHSDPHMGTLPFGQRAKYCYSRDIELVESADILLAECTFPSIGLGIELQASVIGNKPLILIFDGSSSHQALPVRYKNPDESEYDLQIGDGHITLMALGLPNVRCVIRHGMTDGDYSAIISEVFRHLNGGCGKPK